MAFSKGKSTLCIKDITSKVSEIDILSYYLNISKIPCIINSPLREDRRPSFGLYSPNGTNVYFRDFSTGEHGGVFDLLGKLWNTNLQDTLCRIAKDFNKFINSTSISCIHTKKMYKSITLNSNIDIQCKVRDWKIHDIEYWNQYGISLQWLKYAEVYPISHKIIYKDSKKYVFPADKYAYVYIEHKEGKITQKIYQPFNTNGFKWSNKHDKSVISLWTKIPETGKELFICSSLKDALCLSANTKIPAVSIQGEGYSISTTAINELKRRYKTVFICLDNDPPGLKDAEKLAEETGFINIVLPQFEGGKDLSDYRKLKGEIAFTELIKTLLDRYYISTTEDLPFN